MSGRPSVLLCLCFALVAGPSSAHATSSRAVCGLHEAPPDPGDALVGRWSPAGEELVLAIVRSGSVYTGTVVSSPKRPDLVGKPLLRGFAYDASRGVWSGQVFAVKRGEYVAASVGLKGANAFVLTAGSGVFSKDVAWARAR